MTLINRVLGRPEPTPSASAQRPAFDPSTALVGGPAAYGQDAYAPGVYQIPTRVPTWLPAGVTSYRAMETMAPQVSSRQVPVYKNITREVPIEPATRASRARAAAAPIDAEAAATASTTTTRARTATSAAGREVAGEAAAAESTATTRTVTERVKSTKTQVEAKPTLTSHGFLSAVKSSAVVAGAISLVFNGYAVLKGQQSFADGGANVVGDVTAGAVGGAGGVMASAFGAPLLASALGIASGGALTALSFGLGLAGYWAADRMFRHSGFYLSLKNDVRNLLAGTPGAPAPGAYPLPPAQGYPAPYPPANLQPLPALQQ